MDRDNRWDRTELAYRAIVEGKCVREYSNPSKMIEKCYNESLTDEFLPPCISRNYKGFEKNDGFIITNFRADRVRQFLTALCDTDFSIFERKKIQLSERLGLIQYSKRLDKILDSVFGSTLVSNTLGK